MIKYIIKKILYSLLILWGVISVIFILFNVLPGDPAQLMLGQRSDQKSVELINKDLGLDQPLYLQYIKYLNDLSPISIHNKINSESFFYFDSDHYSGFAKLYFGGKSILVLKKPYLRRSFQSKNSVSKIIRDTFINTLVLAFSSIVFASFIGILWGIFCALFKNSVFDRISVFLSAFGMSLPSFFAAILIGWLFAFVLHRFTNLNLTGNLYEIDDFGEGKILQLKNLILPSVTLGIRPLSVVLQLTRNTLLETLSKDYIRTAKAKGLPYRKIIYKHALKNSLSPVISAISGWFASMLAGVVFVEYIFGWKGLGFVIVNALNSYDLPVIMGCVLVISCMFIIVNILVDIFYAFLDPRVRLS